MSRQRFSRLCSFIQCQFESSIVEESLLPNSIVLYTVWHFTTLAKKLIVEVVCIPHFIEWFVLLLANGLHACEVITFDVSLSH